MIVFILFTITLLVLSIINLVITIQYLGPTFDRKKSIDVKNWHRKWILFFSWFTIVLSGLSLLFNNQQNKYKKTVNGIVISEINISNNFSLLFTILPILTNIFTIIYLGPTFGRNKKIKVDNWMRKWVLFFAWFNIVIIGMFFGIGVLGAVIN